MKHIVKYLGILSLFIFQLDAQILYRQAQMSDSDELMELYETFDQDGVNNLLLFPLPVRQAILESSIQKNRIFLAVDEFDNNRIVAFAKAFCITDSAERDEIFQSELRIKLAATGGIRLNAGVYEVSRDLILNFRSELLLKKTFMDQEEILDFVSYNNADTVYIYVGGMYTRKAYRGQGINTALLQYAFTTIKADTIQYLSENRASQYLALVYGQVQANAAQKIQVRPFAEFVLDIKGDLSGIFTEACNLLYASYRSYKPDISIADDGEIICGPDREENKGQGNILIACIKDIE